MTALHILEKLRGLGFNFVTLPRYERQVVAERGGFAALLEYTPAGEIRQYSSAGYLIEGQVGMLMRRGGRDIFVAKQKEVHATAEMLARYEAFKEDLRSALSNSTSSNLSST